MSPPDTLKVDVDQKLTILLHGNLLWSRLGASYKRAYERLGHDVFPIDIRERSSHLPWWLTNRIASRITRHSFSFRRWGASSWIEHMIDKAQVINPDLAFILEGRYVTPKAIRQLKEVAGDVFLFNADSPFLDNPNGRPEHLPAAREADYFFTWSRSLADRLRAKGVSPVGYLPFAWDPQWFPQRDQEDNPSHDVVFIGNWDRHRERWLEPVAEQFDLKIWGGEEWRNRTAFGSALKRCWQGGKLPGPEAAQVIADAKICLNVLREQNLPDGTNMRTFEVPGCGGFLLSNRTEGAFRIFPEEKAGAYFRDRDEMLRQIEYYLSHSEERREIASRAHDIVRNHTYADRAEQIMETYQGERLSEVR